MTKTRMSIALLALSLTAASAQADSLRDIYELALENDAQLKAEEAQYLANLEQENLGRSALLPQINANYDYTNQDTESTGESITVGDIVLDPVAHKVRRRGSDLKLGPTEYRLLQFFMESPGRVFSRGQLLDGVWGTESDIELRTVDVHIRRLRKAIEIEGADDPIRTVRSAGYSLEV